jgi:hypothetical protein
MRELGHTHAARRGRPRADTPLRLLAFPLPRAAPAPRGNIRLPPSAPPLAEESPATAHRLAVPSERLSKLRRVKAPRHPAQIKEEPALGAQNHARPSHDDTQTPSAKIETATPTSPRTRACNRTCAIHAAPDPYIPSNVPAPNRRRADHLQSS